MILLSQSISATSVAHFEEALVCARQSIVMNGPSQLQPTQHVTQLLTHTVRRTIKRKFCMCRVSYRPLVGIEPPEQVL